MSSISKSLIKIFIKNSQTINLINQSDQCKIPHVIVIYTQRFIYPKINKNIKIITLFTQNGVYYNHWYTNFNKEILWNR